MSNSPPIFKPIMHKQCSPFCGAFNMANGLFFLSIMDGQVFFDFDPPTSSAAYAATTEEDKYHSLDDFLAHMKAATSQIARDHERDIRDQNRKIFEIKTHNDYELVEADYGAPIEGLSFFRRLIDPSRSFRYAPTYYNDVNYITHKEQIEKIIDALKQQGYQTFGNLTEDLSLSCVHFSNGGVTKAFSDVVQFLVHNANNFQKAYQDFGFGYTPAILVPVPTYGLFLWRLDEISEKTGLKIIPVRRTDNGAVDLNSLKFALALCREQGVRPIAFYDSNPNNPTGHIRSEEETKDIADTLHAWALQLYDEIFEFIHEEFEKKDISEENKNKIRKFIMSMETPLSAITIIDDMAYEGLEFPNEEPPFSFAQVSDRVAANTVVLKGVSKIGLPGARIGLTIAPPEFNESVLWRELSREFTASSIGVDIITQRYAGSEYKDKFDRHIKSLAKKHLRNAGVLEAFFYGLDNTDKLTKKQKYDLVTAYSVFKDIDITDAKEILLNGLPMFGLLGDQKCGFFRNVDCENLKAKPIFVKINGSEQVQAKGIFLSDTLRYVFKGFGINTVVGESQGYPSGALTVRVTTSLPDDQMFKFFDGMREMQDHFFGEKPQVQLDLFHKNHFKPV